MATLAITAGAVSSTITISNAKMLEWAQLYIDAHLQPGGPVVPPDATNQQKLDWVTRQIGRDFRDKAIGQKARVAGATAEQTTLQTEEATDWA